MNKTNNAFAGNGGLLGAGFGDLMNEGDQFSEVALDEITVNKQVRESFEDEENSLDEMAESIRKHKVFQPILIRPVENGPRPYELVAGERRYLGSQRAGKTNIPALIRVLTDEEARDMQFAENIQRKNLTQVEEAKRIQADLDELGSIDAVLAKHAKSRAWLSKILSLLKLPEETKRLVSEKISADVELINNVKTIEKIDPKEAKALVDDLKKTRGKENARDKVEAVKEKVKPSKKTPKENAATPKNLEHQEPGTATVQNFAPAKKGPENNDDVWPFAAPAKDAKGDNADLPRQPTAVPVDALNKAFSMIFESGSSPQMILDNTQAKERDDVEAWLHSFYDAGKQSKDTGRAVIQGFRNATFASTGARAFALIAFLHGADSDVKFNLINILADVKE